MGYKKKKKEKRKKDEAWLKRLIQAFISQLAKISEYEPSCSLQKHLLDLVGPQLEGNDLPSGLEGQEHFASIAEAICTSLSERKPGVDLLNLINSQKPDKTVALVFKKIVLAANYIHPLELFQQKEKFKFLVKICVYELVLQVVKKKIRARHR